MIQSITQLEEEVNVNQDKMVAEFWSGGADDLYTVAENKAAYSNYRIVPQYMRDVSTVDTTPKRDLFGKKYAMPIGVAPSSLQMLATPKGEAATAGAAETLKFRWASRLTPIARLKKQKRLVVTRLSFSNCMSSRTGTPVLIWFYEPKQLVIKALC